MYYSQLTCLHTAQLFDAFFLIISLSSNVLWIYSPERTFPWNNVCSEDWPNPVHTSKLAGSGNPDMLFPGGRLTHNHKNSRPIAGGWHARKYFDLKLDKSQFDSFALSTNCPWTFHVWIQKQSFTDEMPKCVLFMTICLWNDTVCSKAWKFSWDLWIKNQQPVFYPVRTLSLPIRAVVITNQLEIFTANRWKLWEGHL